MIFPQWKLQFRTFADGTTEWYAMRRKWLWYVDAYNADSEQDVLRYIRTETVVKKKTISVARPVTAPPGA